MGCGGIVDDEFSVFAFPSPASAAATAAVTVSVISAGISVSFSSCCCKSSMVRSRRSIRMLCSVIRVFDELPALTDGEVG